MTIVSYVFHLKPFSSATYNLKMSSYRNSSCIKMIIYNYKNVSSTHLLQVQDTLFWLWSSYATFADYIISLVLDIPFFSAVAFCCLVTWFRYGFSVMYFDDFCHIANAAVADFNCIVVENFMKFAPSLKMFCY